MTCKRYQQYFYENFGTRDYDCFEENEDNDLKLKIGFMLFGTPERNENLNILDEDYTVARIFDKKQNKLINKLYSVIKTKSIYNENKDQVFISFLFNCCEFPKKKEEDEEKIACYRIFRVRKCNGSPENKNCCVYIDEKLRVYENWKDYLENNKIPKCKMFVPKDGKYQGNNDNEVLLEELLSPACAVKEKIIKVADISTGVVSLVTGGIAIAAVIPAVTVAPVVLIGTLATNFVVNVYFISRGSVILHDRNIHGQGIITVLLQEINLKKLGQTIIKNYENVKQLCQLILCRFEDTVQEIIMKLLKFLLNDIIQDAYNVLKQIFPVSEIVVNILKFVIHFLKLKVSEMEINYHQKNALTIREFNISEDECNGFKSPWEKMAYFLKLIVLKSICENGKPHEIFFREMIKFFWDWLSEKAMQRTNNICQQNNQSLQNNNQKRKIIPCSECGGFYYID